MELICTEIGINLQPESWPGICPAPLDITAFPPLDLLAPESWPEIDITAQPPLDLYEGFARLDLNAEKGTGRPGRPGRGKSSTPSRKAQKRPKKRLE